MSRFPETQGQCGLATALQLKRAGATPDALAHLAATGRRGVRGVYAPTKGPWTADVLLRAGLLWAGPQAAPTGGRPLALHGVELPRAPVATRFLVPVSHRSRRSARGYITVRTRAMPATVVRGGVQVVSLERALVDAGRYAEFTRAELKGLTLAVLQRRLSTDDRLATEIEGGWNAAVPGIREGVLAHRAGAWSVPEAALQAAVERCADLPPMLANPRRETLAGEFIGVPDGFFPDAGVVVQVHSRAHHDGVDVDGHDQWAATVERDNEYTCRGLVVVPVTPETIRDRLDAYLEGLVTIVDGRGAGRVTVCGSVLPNRCPGTPCAAQSCTRLPPRCTRCPGTGGLGRRRPRGTQAEPAASERHTGRAGGVRQVGGTGARGECPGGVLRCASSRRDARGAVR